MKRFPARTALTDPLRLPGMKERSLGFAGEGGDVGGREGTVAGKVALDRGRVTGAECSGGGDGGSSRRAFAATRCWMSRLRLVDMMKVCDTFPTPMWFI